MKTTMPDILPLENGDRLTRAEFERRYHAMPQVKKAELIEGVVYMQLQMRSAAHARPHSLIITWLGVYAAATPGVEVGDNATVRLDLDNEPQPDALLRLDEHCGGQTRLSADDYLEGAPEFIAEITASSASYDLYDKRRAYQRNGVQEYLVWQVHERHLDWWHLRDDAYVPLAPDAQGTVRSEVFPGLWLAVPALLDGKLAEVLTVLQAGLATPEHGAFVDRLRRQV